MMAFDRQWGGAMNVKRGLWRFWLVASLSWFAFTAHEYDGIKKTLYALNYALHFEELRHDLRSPAQTEESYRTCMALADLVRGPLKPIVIDLNSPVSISTAVQQDEQWKARSHECRHDAANREPDPPDMGWVALAILPQTAGLALVTLIGYLMMLVARWIYQGFHDDERKG